MCFICRFNLIISLPRFHVLNLHVKHVIQIHFLDTSQHIIILTTCFKRYAYLHASEKTSFTRHVFKTTSLPRAIATITLVLN